MKGFGLVALGVLGCLTLAGCLGGPSVVGKWTGTVPMQGQNFSATMEFKADKTYVMDLSIPMAAGVSVRAEGSYTFGEGQLKTTVTRANLEGELPPQAQMVKGMIEQGLRQMEGQTSTSTVTFSDADTMVLKNEQGEQTLTRVTE